MTNRKSIMGEVLEITTFILIGGGVTGYWEAKNLVYLLVFSLGLVLGITIIINSIIKRTFKEGAKKAILWFIAIILVVIFFKTIQILAISLADSSKNQVGSDSWFNLLSALIGAAVGSGLAVWGALFTQKKADEKSENRMVRENAIIVYFDLYLGLNDLKKLYIGIKSNDRANMPIRMYFSSEWIKNVAMLEKYLRDDVSEIYLLYGELLTIADFLGNNKDAADAIISLADKVFNKEHIIDPINEFNQSYEKAKWNAIKKADLDIKNEVNADYRLILEKLNELRSKGMESADTTN
jgi:hypothetical protein